MCSVVMMDSNLKMMESFHAGEYTILITRLSTLNKWAKFSRKGSFWRARFSCLSETYCFRRRPRVIFVLTTWSTWASCQDKYWEALSATSSLTSIHTWWAPRSSKASGGNQINWNMKWTSEVRTKYTRRINPSTTRYNSSVCTKGISKNY